jgi:hypothetical protein
MFLLVVGGVSPADFPPSDLLGEAEMGFALWRLSRGAAAHHLHHST